MTVAIGIVTYNSAAHIGQCLASVAAQDYPAIKVMIVDNNSADQTISLLNAEWPQYRVLANACNVGFGRAHNQIIATVPECAYYMPLNPDVILHPDYVSRMVAFIEQAGADVGWLSGRLYLRQENDQSGTRFYSVGHAVFRDGHALNIGYEEQDAARYNTAREVFGANAAAPLYRRAMLEQIQAHPGEVYDSRIFLFGEDVDLDWRARLTGWRCFYNPAAIGYHSHGASGGTRNLKIMRTVTANRYYTSFKCNFLVDVLLYSLPLFLVHCLHLLITQPGRGVVVLSLTARRIPEIIHQRHWLAQRRTLTRSQLHAWFEWSRQHRGQQPVGLLERFVNAQKPENRIG
jgi:GT2 family glycosyltransferase